MSPPGLTQFPLDGKLHGPVSDLMQHARLKVSCAEVISDGTGTQNRKMLRVQDGNPAKNYDGYDGFDMLKKSLLQVLHKNNFEDVDIVNMTCLPHSAEGPGHNIDVRQFKHHDVTAGAAKALGDMNVGFLTGSSGSYLWHNRNTSQHNTTQQP